MCVKVMTDFTNLDFMVNILKKHTEQKLLRRSAEVLCFKSHNSIQREMSSANF